MFRDEPSAMRLVKGKDKKGSDRYRLVDGSLDLAAIRKDFAEGYTIVLDGVEQYVRPVGTLARSLEVELHFPIQVNTYVTPPGQTGLAPHYDDHDVLILQIEGSKIWHLYVGADMPPREIQRDKDKAIDVDGLPPPTDVRLEAGDVLYVPRGRIHAAETAADQSIHLTVGIHAPTVLMLAIGALYSQSFRDDRLNQRVPPRHLENAELDATLRGLVREAVGTVEDPGAMAGGLGLLADVLVRRGLCPPVGKFRMRKGSTGNTGGGSQRSIASEDDLQWRHLQVRPARRSTPTSTMERRPTVAEAPSRSTSASSRCADSYRSAARSVSPAPCPAPGRLMEIADLTRWTPVRLDFSGPTPTVDWADLFGRTTR